MSQLLARISAALGDPDIVARLGQRLAGADLTSLLMAMARERVRMRAPADVLRQYARDRFVAPASVDGASLRRVEAQAFALLPAGFEPLLLAPLLPLGAHAAVARGRSEEDRQYRAWHRDRGRPHQWARA